MDFKLPVVQIALDYPTIGETLAIANVEPEAGVDLHRHRMLGGNRCGASLKKRC